MTTTRIFTRAELLDEFNAPYGGNDKCKIICDEIFDTSRWSIHYCLVFQLPDQPDNEAWEVYYSVGATEQQDESPWEYEDKIVATLVTRQEKTVTVWE